MIRNIFILFTLFCCLLLASCKVGPDYHRPTLPIPANYKEMKNKKFVPAQSNLLVTQGPWWTIFHDAQLNTLENQLTLNDQNIITAKAQYDEAKALVDKARAAYFPTLSVTPSAILQKGSSFRSNSSDAHVMQTVSLDAAWEADIWGATRRNVESTVATAESAKAQLAAMRLSESASLAQYYFELRGVDSDQQLLDKTVIADKKILSLTNNRFHQGTASMNDILTARTQLENAQATAINNGINRALYEHAIAVLTGKSPAELTLSFHPFYGNPPPIPAELPSQLLERRPDIVAAERNVAAANAQIGVAVSAYFPVLNFVGNMTFQRNNYGDWFSLPLTAWSIGPALAETILDGGLRHATVEAARASYRATVAQYRQTVLSAFQSVEDNLAAMRILQSQAMVANHAARDANEALQLTMNAYRAGTASYPDIYISQVSAYTAQKNAVDVTTLRMTYAVALVKALGGDFTETKE